MTAVKTFIISLVICFGPSFAVLAQNAPDQVVILAPKILDLVEHGGTGKYQLILREAARRSGFKISEKVYPPKRALLLLKDRKGLCVYTLTPQARELLGEENIITSYPLGVAKLHLFTAKGSPVISRWLDLGVKKIGGVRGFEHYFAPLVRHGFKVRYSNNEENLLKMLVAGRIDVLAGFLPDHFANLARLSYAPNFAILQIFDFMTCRNTPAGKSFVARISKSLKQMKSDGTIKKIIGAAYIDFDYPLSK